MGRRGAARADLADPAAALALLTADELRAEPSRPQVVLSLHARDDGEAVRSEEAGPMTREQAIELLGRMDLGHTVRWPDGPR